MIGLLGKVLAPTVIDSVGNFAGRFFGNKEKREDAAAIAQGKVLDQYASEFSYRDNRTMWDSFVDGFNRLPRPVGFTLTLWLFVWPIWDLESFLSAMKAYEAFPEWMGVLIISVWGFYYAGKLLTKDIGFKAVSSKKMEEILVSQREIRETFAAQQEEEEVPQPDPYVEVQGRLSNEAFTKALASPAPMSLPAIVEWNRRKKEGKL
jgi:hypothetical protein